MKKLDQENLNEDWISDRINSLYDTKVFISKHGEVVVQDLDSISGYPYVEILRGKNPTTVVGKRGRQMKVSIEGKLSTGDRLTERNLNRAKLNLENLSMQEESMTSQIRPEFHRQIDVSRNLLRQIRAEIGEFDLHGIAPEIVSAARQKEQELILKHWQQLISQMRIEEAYCV